MTDDVLNHEIIEDEVKSADCVESKKFTFQTVEVKELIKDGVNVGRISGYASTHGNIDRVGDVVERGAFQKTIDHYKSIKRPIRMYYQHDDKEIIGAFHAEAMREDEFGLYVEGDINLDVQRGKEVYALAKQGVLSDLSIGYTVKDFDIKAGVRHLKEVELWEVSVVSEPANPLAKITQVKSIDVNDLKEHLNTKRDAERLLREAGFSRSAAKFFVSLTNINSEVEELAEEKKEDEMTEVKLCDEVLETEVTTDVETVEEKEVEINICISEDGQVEAVEDMQEVELVEEPVAEVVDEKPAADAEEMRQLLSALKLLLEHLK